MDEKQTPSFFMQFPYSFQPPKYADLMRVKNGAMIGFIVLLLFILTVLSYIQLCINFNSKNFTDMLNKFPDFSFENGILRMEEDYISEGTSGDLYIKIEKDAEKFSVQDAAAIHDQNGYDKILLISKNNLIFGNSEEDYADLDFKDFRILTFDKNMILNKFIPSLPVMAGIGYLLYFIWRSLWYFFCAGLYMLLSMLFAKIFHREIAAGILFKTSVYAKVLMTVAAFAVSIIPVSLSIPPYIRTFITIGMIVFAFQFLPEKYETEI